MALDTLAFGGLDIFGNIIAGVNGLDYNPGSDVDVDIATIGVTGTPRFFWDESDNGFRMSLGLNITAGNLYLDAGYLQLISTSAAEIYLKRDDGYFYQGVGNDWKRQWHTADANANHALSVLPVGDATNVPVSLLANSSGDADLGLFDGVTQPAFAALEKNGKYASASDATSSGADTTLTVDGSEFTGAVIGDVLRVTAGTNATAGWYVIKTVTDANNVVLDRNWCSGAVSGGTFVCYHDFTMLSADGFCTRITNASPTDSSVEIDRDGWLILDVSQANGRLWWRANNGWHYVDATA